MINLSTSTAPNWIQTQPRPQSITRGIVPPMQTGQSSLGPISVFNKSGRGMLFSELEFCVTSCSLTWMRCSIATADGTKSLHATDSFTVGHSVSHLRSTNTTTVGASRLKPESYVPQPRFQSLILQAETVYQEDKESYEWRLIEICPILSQVSQNYRLRSLNGRILNLTPSSVFNAMVLSEANANSANRCLVSIRGMITRYFST